MLFELFYLFLVSFVASITALFTYDFMKQYIKLRTLQKLSHEWEKETSKENQENQDHKSNDKNKDVMELLREQNIKDFNKDEVKEMMSMAQTFMQDFIKNPEQNIKDIKKLMQEEID